MESDNHTCPWLLAKISSKMGSALGIQFGAFFHGFLRPKTQWLSNGSVSFEFPRCVQRLDQLLDFSKFHPSSCLLPNASASCVTPRNTQVQTSHCKITILALFFVVCSTLGQKPTFYPEITKNLMFESVNFVKKKKNDYLKM